MHNHRTARDRAADIIQSVRNAWYPVPTPPSIELDALPSDLLQELHDERLMTGERT